MSVCVPRCTLRSALTRPTCGRFSCFRRPDRLRMRLILNNFLFRNDPKLNIETQWSFTWSVGQNLVRQLREICHGATSPSCICPASLLQRPWQPLLSQTLHSWPGPSQHKPHTTQSAACQSAAVRYCHYCEMRLDIFWDFKYHNIMIWHRCCFCPGYEGSITVTGGL